jgi:Fe-S-cluster containining protein
VTATSAHNELQEAFYNDGYRIAAEHLTHDRSEGSLVRAMHSLYAVLDAFVEIFLESAAQSETPSNCKKGCAWCCHQAVFAETHTLRYLAGWIHEHLTENQRKKVTEAARIKLDKTGGLPRPKRLMYKYPCPLLADNACMAYAGRPVACRIYLSSNVDSCRHEFKHPEERSVFPQLFALPLELGRKLNEGFAAWLQENVEEIDEYPLEEGLLKFLEVR